MERFLFVFRQQYLNCPQTKCGGISESASEDYIFLPGIKEDVVQAAAVVQEAELLRGSRAAALPSRIDGRVNPYWVLFDAI